MSFATDLLARLVAQGVGVAGTSLFVSSKAIIPTGAGPYTTISELGGMMPSRTQNSDAAATQRPTAQILVRALNEPTARAKSWEAYQALDGIFNTSLGGTFYLRIVARQEPTDMGLDESGRMQYVFNLEAEKQPS